MISLYIDLEEAASRAEDDLLSREKETVKLLERLRSCKL